MYLQEALALLGGTDTCVDLCFNDGTWTASCAESIETWGDMVIDNLISTDTDFTKAVHGLREKVVAYIASQEVQHV